jgi:nitrite reductase (NADH) small subunit
MIGTRINMHSPDPTSPRDSSGWIDLCAVADLPPEGGHYVEHGHRALAVIRVPAKEGKAEVIRVLDDHCPHAGGSLSAGAVIDGCVICPWHAWPFDIHTGICPDAEAYRAKVYESRVEGGRVWVKI